LRKLRAERTDDELERDDRSAKARIDYLPNGRSRCGGAGWVDRAGVDIMSAKYISEGEKVKAHTIRRGYFISVRDDYKRVARVTRAKNALTKNGRRMLITLSNGDKGRLLLGEMVKVYAEK